MFSGDPSNSCCSPCEAPVCQEAIILMCRRCCCDKLCNEYPNFSRKHSCVTHDAWRFHIPFFFIIGAKTLLYRVHSPHRLSTHTRNAEFLYSSMRHPRCVAKATSLRWKSRLMHACPRCDTTCVAASSSVGTYSG